MTNEKKNARRLHYIAIFGGQCCQCRSIEKLEFDHIDPRTKTKQISFSWSLPHLEAELKLCQLLCQKCHIAKSRAEFATYHQHKLHHNRSSFKSLPIPHGTWSGYISYRCRCHECKHAGNAYDRARYHGDLAYIQSDKDMLRAIRSAQLAALMKTSI